MPARPLVIIVTVDNSKGDSFSFNVAVRYTGVADEESGPYLSERDDYYPALLDNIIDNEGKEFEKARALIAEKCGDDWEWAEDGELTRYLSEEGFKNFKGPRLTVHLGQAKAQ